MVAVNRAKYLHIYMYVYGPAPWRFIHTGGYTTAFSNSAVFCLTI